MENDIIIDEYEDMALEQAGFLGFYNSYDGEEDQTEEDQPDSREYVNGEWTPLEFGFDDDEEFDEEFDNLFGKRAKARRKKRRAYRKSGLSRKQARKKARSEVRKEMGRNKLGSFVKKIQKSKVGKFVTKVGRKIGKFIAKVALAIPRVAYMSLMRINYLGQATKIARAKDMPKYAKQWKIIKRKWEKMGGSVKSLIISADKGKKRKPFLCGKKCKSKLKGYKNFLNADGSVDAKKLNRDLIHSLENRGKIEDEFDDLFGIDDTALGIWIASATAVIGTFTGVLSSVASSKREKEAMALATKRNKQEMDLMTKSQKKQLELAEIQVKNALSPRNQILNNSTLTQAQKNVAVAELDKMTEKTLSKKSGRNIKKWLLFGGLGLVGIIAIILVAKRRS